MFFLKLNGGVGAVLVALAVLAATSQPALAGSKTLVCTTTDNWQPAGLQITVDLNEAGGTATVNYLARDQSPASSLGPLSATFDAKNVVFDDSSNGQYRHFTLDRLTGRLADYSSSGKPWDEAAPADKLIRNYNCEAAKAKF